MSRKHLLALSLLLPLVGLSGAAYAGSTISDRSYWPEQARVTTFEANQAPVEWNSARAQVTGTQRFEPATTIYSDRNAAPRYHGGPKSSQ